MLYPTKDSTEFYTAEGCHIIEIINRADHQEVSIARARVQAGITTQWHTVNVREIYYLLSGHGRAEIGDETMDVHPGDAVSIPAGVRQRITNTDPKEDLIFLCVCSPRFTPEGYREV